MTYLLDANVLIEGSRFCYAFDLAPGYWDWLEAIHGIGDIASVAAVRDGLTVVTRETAEPFRRNRVKIPDVCIGLTVTCENPFPVDARLGLRLGA